jgi:hypothetical protein
MGLGCMSWIPWNRKPMSHNALVWRNIWKTFPIRLVLWHGYRRNKEKFHTVTKWIFSFEITWKIDHGKINIVCDPTSKVNFVLKIPRKGILHISYKVALNQRSLTFHAIPNEKFQSIQPFFYFSENYDIYVMILKKHHQSMLFVQWNNICSKFMCFQFVSHLTCHLKLLWFFNSYFFKI